MLIIFYSVFIEVCVRVIEIVRVNVDCLSFYWRLLVYVKLVLGVMVIFVVVLKINIFFLVKKNSFYLF